MSKITQLTEGAHVIFSKIPCGSYLTAGEVYTVEWNDGKSCYFRNNRRHGGTYDKAWAIQMSEFTIITPEMIAA